MKIAAHSQQKTMAKNSQIWDDSALVKALDDAISKYKIMHSKGGDGGSFKEAETITKDDEESSPNLLTRSNKTKTAYGETNDKNTDEQKKSIDTRKTTDSTVTEKGVVEKEVSPSNGDQVQDTDYNYVNAESTEQYNVLLNQYNAVEEQRQKLLQQLYQYGNWESQGYSYGYGYSYDSGATYDSQYRNVSAPQTSGPPVCTCRPYVCPYSTAPCTSSETCVGSTACAHYGNSGSLDDDGFIKAAMGAVDKAIHSFNKEATDMPNVEQDGKKGQEVETGSVNVARDKTSQTDLSAVLHAWFSAGFYTGKYLSEQASTKK
ncbi:uncharacterized protein [Rutidosis leptorrhynchoides]|uniref:uncharacterized protein isoform X2 n=1 Tax=Rutidosis leptorrhynchoides TaxID=125765 RepID=UPI003A98E4D7